LTGPVTWARRLGLAPKLCPRKISCKVMLRHSLVRAMSCWKSIKTTMAVLLAVAATIPIVHVGAAILHNVSVPNYLKSRQSDVDGTPASARRAHMAIVTQNKRDLNRRQWRVVGDLALSDSLTLRRRRPRPGGSRARIDKGVQRHTVRIALCACAFATDTSSRSALQSRANTSHGMRGDARKVAARKRACFSIATSMLTLQT
jgi:hypothetical protein